MTQAGSFFERRRAGLLAERAAEARAAEVAAMLPEPEAAGPDLAEMSDADILELLDLPDPDTMKASDNFAAFMAKAVPLHLRNRALRNLWRSDPVLACLDGLNDYEADYLTGSTGQGVIQTTYQVGKGLLAHIEKLAAETAPDADEVSITEDPDTPGVEAEEAAAVTVAEADAPTPPALPPRRMRFAFEGDAA